jgi:uncharacterized protein (DUF1501 family)
MSISRRIFMKQGALALLAMGLEPDFIRRSLLAQTSGAARRKTLVVIFQRGAVDGLNMVIPFDDPGYYSARRSIAIAAPQRGNATGATDLNGFFALHPALRPLSELYARKEMAVVHAVGSPHPTRSHFEAQEFMETAMPGARSEREGWLNRVLQHTHCSSPGCDGRTLADPTAHARDHAAGQVGLASGTHPALRGVALGAALPLVLQGQHPTLAIRDLERFGITEGGGDSPGDTFERLYGAQSSGDLVSTAAEDGFEAAAILRGVDPTRYAPRDGVRYPGGEFGRSLRQIAQLIKADVGVEVAFADLGGWDTHVAQGGAEGQLARRLGEFAQGVRALYDDLGDRMEEVVILTVSEFGRTVAENGSGGTDHGHANCMLVLGGSVAGGRVHGAWPGLAREQLHEGRDLAVTTDFRDVFAEVAAGHLGATRLERIFPGHSVDSRRFPGVLS